MTVDWVCKHHTDLGKEQLYAILRLRCEVFVVERKCVYQDIDGQDLTGDTHHLMAWKDDELMAYLRLLDPGIPRWRCGYRSGDRRTGGTGYRAGPPDDGRNSQAD